MQIVRIEDRAHVTQAVSGDGRDLCFGAADKASRVTAVPRRSLNVTPSMPRLREPCPTMRGSHQASTAALGIELK